jgi:hypothetical protein
MLVSTYSAPPSPLARWRFVCFARPPARPKASSPVRFDAEVWDSMLFRVVAVFLLPLISHNTKQLKEKFVNSVEQKQIFFANFFFSL